MRVRTALGRFRGIEEMDKNLLVRSVPSQMLAHRQVRRPRVSFLDSIIIPSVALPSTASDIASRTSSVTGTYFPILDASIDSASSTVQLCSEVDEKNSSSGSIPPISRNPCGKRVSRPLNDMSRPSLLQASISILSSWNADEM